MKLCVAIVFAGVLMVGCGAEPVDRRASFVSADALPSVGNGDQGPANPNQNSGQTDVPTPEPDPDNETIIPQSTVDWDGNSPVGEDFGTSTFQIQELNFKQIDGGGVR